MQSTAGDAVNGRRKGCDDFRVGMSANSAKVANKLQRHFANNSFPSIGMNRVAALIRDAAVSGLAP